MTKKELNNYIGCFSRLGKLMSAVGNGDKWTNSDIGCNEDEYRDFEEIIELSRHHNGWFTKDSVKKSLLSLGSQLSEGNLTKWLGHYSLTGNDSKKVGIIMAGNIPLVGFHDFLCVILSGNHAVIKLSSDDKILLPALVNFLVKFNPELQSQITFEDERLDYIEAIIATGSNNSSRYFEYYFGKYPNIIRKNRNSIAILDGSETKEELYLLGNDIFDYYGLGCRNVTKIYIPVGYELDTFFKGILEHSDVINRNKYANNYDYNKAVWLLNGEDLLDNGFIILKEEKLIPSATASLNYEYYSDREILDGQLDSQKEEIQCIVSKKDITFGQAQQPEIWDYADGIDTLKFLTEDLVGEK